MPEPTQGAVVTGGNELSALDVTEGERVAVVVEPHTHECPRRVVGDVTDAPRAVMHRNLAEGRTEPVTFTLQTDTGRTYRVRYRQAELVGRDSPVDGEAVIGRFKRFETPRHGE